MAIPSKKKKGNYLKIQLVRVLNIISFISDCAGSLSLRRLSAVAVSGGYPLGAACSFSRAVTSPVAKHGLQWLWHLGSRAQGQ